MVCWISYRWLDSSWLLSKLLQISWPRLTFYYTRSDPWKRKGGKECYNVIYYYHLPSLFLPLDHPCHLVLLYSLPLDGREEERRVKEEGREEGERRKIMCWIKSRQSQRKGHYDCLILCHISYNLVILYLPLLWPD